MRLPSPRQSRNSPRLQPYENKRARLALGPAAPCVHAILASGKKGSLHSGLVEWGRQIQKECAEIPKSPNNPRSDWQHPIAQPGRLREIGAILVQQPNFRTPKRGLLILPPTPAEIGFAIFASICN
jgi:hypothetical protein